MPSKHILRMSRRQQRIHAHVTAIVWHRAGGPVAGHPLQGYFNSVSEVITADGFSIMSGKPRATIFVRDVFAIDPSRADGDPNEVFRIHGADRLVIDGQTYRVESCRADGLNKVELELKEI